MALATEKDHGQSRGGCYFRVPDVPATLEIHLGLSNMKNLILEMLVSQMIDSFNVYSPGKALEQPPRFS